MKKYLLPERGAFYKANLHCHSTLSDGALTPAEIKAHYQEMGYSIVAYSDHNRYVYHEELNDPNFLALGAFEVDMSGTEPSGLFKTCHMNGIAADPRKAVMPPRDNRYDWDAVRAAARRMAEAGFLVTLNHPGWSGMDSKEIQALDEGLFAMEVYNHTCEVHCCNGRTGLHYDQYLKAGRRAFCVATDDNHHPFTPGGINDMCGGFTMIKAESLTYEAVIQALQRGDFYASFGPEIHACYMEDDRLVVDCSPVHTALLKSTQYSQSQCTFSADKPFTHVEFSLEREKQSEPFIRLELQDARGQMAFTNPEYWE